jgi:hypothetical protein
MLLSSFVLKLSLQMEGCNLDGNLKPIRTFEATSCHINDLLSRLSVAGAGVLTPVYSRGPAVKPRIQSGGFRSECWKQLVEL